MNYHNILPEKEMKSIKKNYALCFRKRNRAREIQEEERDPFENFVYVETVNRNQEEKVCERESNLGEASEKESLKYSDGLVREELWFVQVGKVRAALG